MRSFALLTSFVTLSFACAPVPEDEAAQASQAGSILPIPTTIVPASGSFPWPATIFPGGDPTALRCPSDKYIRMEIRNSTDDVFAPAPTHVVVMPASVRSSTWNIPWGQGNEFWWTASYGAERYYGTTAPLGSIMRAVRSSPVGQWTAYSVSYPERQASVSGSATRKELMLVVNNHGGNEYELQVEVWPHDAGTRRVSGVQVDIGRYPTTLSAWRYWFQSVRMGCQEPPPSWDGISPYPISMSRVYQMPGSTLIARIDARGCATCEMRDVAP